MTNNSQHTTSNYQLISVLRREWTRMTSRRPLFWRLYRLAIVHSLLYGYYLR